MLTVIAEIKVREGRENFQTVVDAFKQVTPLVLQESGCHGYALYLDTPTGLSFQQTAANSIIMLEKWQSAEALAAHMNTEHMQNFQQCVQDAVLETKVRILDLGF